MENQRAGHARAGHPAGGGGARWVLVAVLAVVAGGLLAQLARAVAEPTPSCGADGGQGVMAIAGQLSRDSYGIYVIDLANRTMCVYQYLPASKKLRLQAARTFAYDTRLDDLNTEPSPREIKQLVEQQRRLMDLPDEGSERPDEPATRPADEDATGGESDG